MREIFVTNQVKATNGPMCFVGTLLMVGKARRAQLRFKSPY